MVFGTNERRSAALQLNASFIDGFERERELSVKLGKEISQLLLLSLAKRIGHICSPPLLFIGSRLYSVAV